MPEDCTLNIHCAENLKARVLCLLGVNTSNATQNVFQVLSSVNTDHGDDDNDFVTAMATATTIIIITVIVIVAIALKTQDNTAHYLGI